MMFLREAHFEESNSNSKFNKRTIYKYVNFRGTKMPGLLGRNKLKGCKNYYKKKSIRNINY